MKWVTREGHDRPSAAEHVLKHGMVMYDALYALCRSCQDETHRWPPVTAPTA
jgi:hypothetical protein